MQITITVAAKLYLKIHEYVIWPSIQKKGESNSKLS